MPRKKRNSQSPARQSGLPSDWKAQQSENRNVNKNSSSMGVPEAGVLARDAVVSRMQEMFSHLDPDVVYIVLAECDFKVENAMDSLLVLSEGVAPPQVSGFEMAAALLYPKPPEDKATALPSNMSRPMHAKPEGGEDSDMIGTHLTADFDVLIDRELETISTQQTACGSPFSSSCSLSSLPPPELLQSSTEQGRGPGQVSVDDSGSSSPVSGLSFVGGRVYKEEPGQLDFSHLTAEAVSNKPSSLDLGSYGRPSAFQAYRKSPKPNTSGGSQFMESSLEGAALPVCEGGVSLPKNAQEPPQKASSSFWNTQVSEFMPRADRPVFITPVVQSHVPWSMLPTVDWAVRGFGMQAPIKPAATIPKSWAVSAGAKPPQPPRATRLFGQVLVLMRGAPGSGKSTLARSILQQNLGGVVLSTDDYFVRNGRYCFDQSVLSEAHEWNQKRAKEAFEKGVSPIIIDNTNMQSWEMKPYVALALQYKYKVMFREPDTWWRFKPRELERRTKHGVQKEKIRRMLDHFDRHVSIDSIMCSFKKPVEPSVHTVQPSQETSLSQPSASDVRPDLVEEPHLNLELAKAPFQLFSSLPDVSSVGGCYTKEESMGDSSSSSSDQTDSICTSSQYLHLRAEGHEISRVPELDVTSTELQEGHTEEWRVGNCSAASNGREIPDDKETLQFDVKDQANEKPVAFFESISQRVRRDRGCTKQVDADENALMDDDHLPLGHGVVEDGDVEDSGFQTTGGDCVKPELLDFVGDWPTEALEQREQRPRGEKSSEVLEKGSEEQAVSDDGQMQKNCNPPVTEFQKLLDLLQVDTETSQKQMTTSVDSLPGSFDLRLSSEDLIVEAADLVREVSSVSSKEGKSQGTGKDSRPELLDCVEDWTEVDATLAEDLSQKTTTSEEQVETPGVIKKVDGLSLIKNRSIITPDRSEELQRGGLEVCQSSCVTTDPKSASPAAGSALIDGMPVAAGTGGSHERRLRQNRRSGKQCKLALTFTNNSPMSPKFQLESPRLFPHFGPMSPDPVIRSSVTGTNSATQTNPQDFALLWRIDRQHQISTVDLGVKEMEGNSSRFIPKSAEAVEGSGHQEVPYRVMHDKGTLVEEQELSGGNSKLENLQILSRHFKLVAFDMLEDLYDKCHQDIEWTTNLLLDSGEWLFKDDEEDDAVDKDHFTQDSGVDSHMSVKISSSCSEVGTVVSAIENSTAFASFEAQCPRTESYGGLELCPGSEVALSASGELSNVESSAVISRPVDPVGEAEPVIAVELGNSIPVHEEPLAGCSSTEMRKSPELKDFHQEEASEEQERRSENQIEKLEGCSTEEPETPAPKQEEEVVGPCLLETEYEEIGNLLFEGEVSESLLEQIMELKKKQAGDKQKERDRASQAKQRCRPVDIQTLELKLPTELALQLTELFGPVGTDPGSLSPEDCAVQIDLNLARLLHQKWKDTIQKRKRQEVLSYCLLQESSVHWGDSQSAKPGNHGEISQLLLCPDGLVSLGHSDDLPYMDHWNAFQPYVSLRDIMMEEEALQQNMEKLNHMEAQQKDSATLLKEHQLYSLFPTIDRHFLKDIFRDHNYSLEWTEQFLRTLLDEGPVKTVVAPEASQHRDTESKGLTGKTKEPEVAQFQDIEDPEYEDFRAEAVLQRKKQQECFGKAADAYSRGMKEVASFYAQQGHLHGLKMKEANHRAAMQIFKRVNASLLPQNILDLHGLHVDEALYHLAQVLEDKTKECQNSGCRPQLSVITGKGNHSLGGVARIRPAVIDYLKSHSYRFTEPKTGLLLVTLH